MSGRPAGRPGVRGATRAAAAGSAARAAEAGVTRRQLLIGGGLLAAWAAAAGVVASRSWMVRRYWYRLTGAYGEAGTPPPAYPVTCREGMLASVHLKRPAAYVVGYPPGVGGSGSAAAAETPVLICLPGRNRTPQAVLRGGLRMADYVADAQARRGVTPFAVAAVQASDTYWHARLAGDDAMAMLFDEFIPLLRAELGLGGPLAVMGWSIGGYGALRAAELHPERFAAVSAVSAALWRSFEDGVGDAFDGAEDYARNDVYGGVRRLSGLPVRVDCGRQDPFYKANVAFAAALPEPPAGGFTPGGHDDAYWTRVAPAEIDWIGAQLARA